MSEITVDYGVHYDRAHADTPQHWEDMALHFRESLAPVLPADRDATIIDFGCGHGFGIKALTDIGYRNVRGVDADTSQVNHAKRRGLNVEKVSPSESLSFFATIKNASLIYAFDVLEHVPHPEQIALLSAMRSSLASDGVLVLRVPNALSMIANWSRYQDWTHQCLFSSESVGFVLRNAGFSNIEVRDAPDQRPSRPLLAKIATGLIKYPCRIIARGLYRAALISEFGVRRGATLPIGLNIIATARC